MVSGNLNKWQWIALCIGGAVAVGMFVYPPWRCTTSGGYTVPDGVVEALQRGPIQADFPPNEPMLYCAGHRTRVAYGWLFRPPTLSAGMRWSAQLEWGRLLRRFGLILLATLALVFAVRDEGFLLRRASRQALKSTGAEPRGDAGE